MSGRRIWAPHAWHVEGTAGAKAPGRERTCVRGRRYLVWLGCRTGFPLGSGEG